jgi:hypothetical protein
VDQVTKIKDKDAEIEILKEMIKGIKVQLKCKKSLINILSIAKDTDIQRLQMKVKRLEKANDIRDNIYNN